MKGPYLKFDFPGVAPHHALWILTNDLAADAYYIVAGKPVGVRNMELSARYIDLRRQALVGTVQERIALYKATHPSDSEEIKPGKSEVKGRGR